MSMFCIRKEVSTSKLEPIIINIYEAFVVMTCSIPQYFKDSSAHNSKNNKKIK